MSLAVNAKWLINCRRDADRERLPPFAGWWSSCSLIRKETPRDVIGRGQLSVLAVPTCPRSTSKALIAGKRSDIKNEAPLSGHSQTSHGFVQARSRLKERYWEACKKSSAGSGKHRKQQNKDTYSACNLHSPCTSNKPQALNARRFLFWPLALLRLYFISMKHARQLHAGAHAREHAHG